MMVSTALSRHCINTGKMSTKMMLLVWASTILFLLAPLPSSIGPEFASAFTSSTGAIPSRQCNSKLSTLRLATADDAAAATKKTIWTLEELEEFAESETVNVVLSFSTFGPAYRAVARAKHDESIILGYVEGFLRPTQPKLLHLDKMEIFQPVLEKVRKTHPNTLQFGGINIGLGLLMGYRCLLYAADPKQGPRTIAEFLAIDDEDFQHKRLVRYYRYAGFKIVKYVGDDPKDIPDRLIWGGCGTLMKQDIPELMSKWTSLFELMKSRVENQQQAKLAKAKGEENTGK